MEVLPQETMARQESAEFKVAETLENFLAHPKGRLVEMIADMNRPPQPLHGETVDYDEQFRRATYMRDALLEELAKAEAVANEIIGENPSWLSHDNGPDYEKGLRFSGVNADPDWIYAIVSGIIKGEPVRLFASPPRVVTSKGLHSHHSIARHYEPRWQGGNTYTGIATTLHRMIPPQSTNARAGIFFEAEADLAPHELRAKLLTSAAFLKTQGFSNEEFLAGTPTDPNRLTDQFAASPYSKLSYERLDGSIMDLVHLVPTDQMRAWALTNGVSLDEHGVLLGHIPKNSLTVGIDSPALQLLQACRTDLSDTLYLYVTDHRKSSKLTKTQFILKAAGIKQASEYQELGINPHHPYAFQSTVRLFLDQVERFIASHPARQNSFDKMDAKKYREYYYNTAELDPIDLKLIEAEMRLQPWLYKYLDIDPSDARTLLKSGQAAQFCIGPNILPVMVNERFVDGDILGLEISANCRRELEQIKAGKDSAVLKEQEEVLVAMSQRVYDDPNREDFKGCAVRARQKLVPTAFDLRTSTVRGIRLAHASFGPEAITDSQLEYRRVLTTIHDSLVRNTLHVVKGQLRPLRSVFISYVTLGYDDTGWEDRGGNRYLGTKLDLTRAKAAFYDAGFNIVHAEVVGDGPRPQEQLAIMVAVPAEDRYTVPGTIGV